MDFIVCKPVARIETSKQIPLNTVVAGGRGNTHIFANDNGKNLELLVQGVTFLSVGEPLDEQTAQLDQDGFVVAHVDELPDLATLCEVNDDLRQSVITLGGRRFLCLFRLSASLDGMMSQS